MAQPFSLVSSFDIRAILDGFRRIQDEGGRAGTAAGQKLGDGIDAGVRGAEQKARGTGQKIGQGIVQGATPSLTQFGSAFGAALQGAAQQAPAQGQRIGQGLLSGTSAALQGIPSVLSQALQRASGAAQASGRAIGTGIASGAQGPLQSQLPQAIGRALDAARGAASSQGSRYGQSFLQGAQPSLQQGVSAAVERGAQAASSTGQRSGAALGQGIVSGVSGAAQSGIPSVLGQALQASQGQGGTAGQVIGTAVAGGIGRQALQQIPSAITRALDNSRAASAGAGTGIGAAIAGGVRQGAQPIPSTLTSLLSGGRSIGTRAGTEIGQGANQGLQQAVRSQGQTFLGVIQQAQEAARKIGLIFRETDLTFRTIEGDIIPDEVLANLERANAGFREARQALQGLQAAANGATPAIRAGGSALDRFGAASELVQGAVTGFAFAISDRLVQAFLNLGTTITGVLGKFVAYDQELRKAIAITAEGGDAYDRLKLKLDQVAAAAAGTPIQVAQLSTSLAKAGFTVDQLTEAMPGIILGAEATGTAFEEMGSIVANTLRAFNIGVEDTQKVTDILVNTANRSNQSITDLGQALEYAAPTAFTLGISLEDLSATLGLLALSGIKASTAGTALRSGLGRLQQAAGGANDEALGLVRGQELLGNAMRTLGAEVLDLTTGKLKPMDQVLLQLKGTLDGFNTTQKIELTKALFGEEAGGKILSITNQTTEAIQRMFAVVRNSEGAAQEARKAMDSFGLSLTSLEGSIEGVTNIVALLIAKGLKPLVDGANSVLSVILGLPGPIQALVGATVILTGAWIASRVALVAFEAAMRSEAIAGFILQTRALAAGMVAALIPSLTKATAAIVAMTASLRAFTVAEATAQIVAMRTSLAALATQALATSAALGTNLVVSAAALGNLAVAGGRALGTLGVAFGAAGLRALGFGGAIGQGARVAVAGAEAIAGASQTAGAASQAAAAGGRALAAASTAAGRATAAAATGVTQLTLDLGAAGAAGTTAAAGLNAAGTAGQAAGAGGTAAAAGLGAGLAAFVAIAAAIAVAVGAYVLWNNAQKDARALSEPLNASLREQKDELSRVGIELRSGRGGADGFASSLAGISTSATGAIQSILDLIFPFGNLVKLFQAGKKAVEEIYEALRKAALIDATKKNYQELEERLASLGRAFDEAKAKSGGTKAEQDANAKSIRRLANEYQAVLGDVDNYVAALQAQKAAADEAGDTGLSAFLQDQILKYQGLSSSREANLQKMEQEAGITPTLTNALAALGNVAAVSAQQYAVLTKNLESTAKEKEIALLNQVAAGNITAAQAALQRAEAEATANEQKQKFLTTALAALSKEQAASAEGKKLAADLLELQLTSAQGAVKLAEARVAAAQEEVAAINAVFQAEQNLATARTQNVTSGLASAVELYGAMLSLSKALADQEQSAWTLEVARNQGRQAEQGRELEAMRARGASAAEIKQKEEEIKAVKEEQRLLENEAFLAGVAGLRQRQALETQMFQLKQQQAAVEANNAVTLAQLRAQEAQQVLAAITARGNASAEEIAAAQSRVQIAGIELNTATERARILGEIQGIESQVQGIQLQNVANQKIAEGAAKGIEEATRAALGETTGLAIQSEIVSGNYAATVDPAAEVEGSAARTAESLGGASPDAEKIRDMILGSVAPAEGVETAVVGLAKGAKDTAQQAPGVGTLATNLGTAATNSDSLLGWLNKLPAAFTGLKSGTGFLSGIAQAFKNAAAGAASLLSALRGIVGIPDGRWMGGDVTPGWRGTVNELGQESFLSAQGKLSLITAPRSGMWTAPQAGTVLPHSVTAQLKERGAFDRIAQQQAAGSPLSPVGMQRRPADMGPSLQKLSRTVGRLSRAVNELAAKNWNAQVVANVVAPMGLYGAR
jgi:TP901 family phage tail tape measure protein